MARSALSGMKKATFLTQYLWFEARDSLDARAWCEEMMELVLTGSKSASL